MESGTVIVISSVIGLFLFLVLIHYLCDQRKRKLNIKSLNKQTEVKRSVYRKRRTLYYHDTDEPLLSADLISLGIVLSDFDDEYVIDDEDLGNETGYYDYTPEDGQVNSEIEHSTEHVYKSLGYETDNSTGSYSSYPSSDFGGNNDSGGTD